MSCVTHHFTTLLNFCIRRIRCIFEEKCRESSQKLFYIAQLCNLCTATSPPFSTSHKVEEEKSSRTRRINQTLLKLQASWQLGSFSFEIFSPNKTSRQERADDTFGVGRFQSGLKLGQARKKSRVSFRGPNTASITGTFPLVFKFV